jgi:hypothetical protein
MLQDRGTYRDEVPKMEGLRKGVAGRDTISQPHPQPDERNKDREAITVC